VRVKVRRTDCGSGFTLCSRGTEPSGIVLTGSSAGHQAPAELQGIRWFRWKT
jgi:hypothetical protein